MAQSLVLDPSLPVQLIHQFPLPTWIENLAIRSNGQILLTLLTTPELYLVDPANPKEAKLVHKFDKVSAMTGIIEVEDDVFYVAGGNFNLATFANEQGSHRLWKVDMKSFDKDSQATVKEIAHLTDSGLLNGFCLLSKSAGTILMADSEMGCVWKVNVNNGKVEKAISVEEMIPPPPPDMPLGINGIKVRDSYLYWTNTGRKIFCRIKINEDGKATGDAEILERDTLVDDFVFDRKGSAWLAQNSINIIGVVKPGGGVLTVAGRADQLTVAGGTACQFGRKGDEHILYVTTTGGLAAPIDGTKVEGGKVVAIDTTKFEN